MTPRMARRLAARVVTVALLVMSAGAASPKHVQTGLASIYGKGWQGRHTASGGTFDPGAMTGSHASLPFGTRVRVTAIASGRAVEVTINDRPGRGAHHLIDLTPAAARKIGLDHGTARVRVEVLNLLESPK